jgi:hypothetical protein
MPRALRRTSKFIDPAVPSYVSTAHNFGKKAKVVTLEPPEKPHYEQPTRLFEEAFFLPGDDAWGHFNDDGEGDEMRRRSSSGASLETAG